VPSEPIPSTVFAHDAENARLHEQLLARDGRRIFAEHQCAKCHQPPSPWPATAMPELAADAPAFDGIGSRLQATWMAQCSSNRKRFGGCANAADAFRPASRR